MSAVTAEIFTKDHRLLPVQVPPTRDRDAGRRRKNGVGGERSNACWWNGTPLWSLITTPRPNCRNWPRPPVAMYRDSRWTWLASAPGAKPAPVVAGVRFMGKKPPRSSIRKNGRTDAGPACQCSLDLGCPSRFAAFCDQHPRTDGGGLRQLSSAAVKSPFRLGGHLGYRPGSDTPSGRTGRKTDLGADRHLGAYVRRGTGVDMLLWSGSCVVHEAFKADGLRKLRARIPTPGAGHPNRRWMSRCPGRCGRFDHGAGRSGAQAAGKKKFIVATDNGLFHKMKQAAPDKMFLEAPTGGKGATCVSCAHCPWMAMNGLPNLARYWKPVGTRSSSTQRCANGRVRPIRRLLEFKPTAQAGGVVDA